MCVCVCVCVCVCNENPSFFKMSFKMSFLTLYNYELFLQIILPCAAYCTFYMFESLDGLWVGGGGVSDDNSEIL